VKPRVLADADLNHAIVRGIKEAAVATRLEPAAAGMSAGVVSL
jgi:hypothetical protein